MIIGFKNMDLFKTKERNEILKIFTQKWRELQLYIKDLEDGNAFLLDRYWRKKSRVNSSLLIEFNSNQLSL